MARALRGTILEVPIINEDYSTLGSTLRSPQLWEFETGFRDVHDVGVSGVSVQGLGFRVYESVGGHVFFFQRFGSTLVWLAP